jgi:hypothetical protein
LPKRLKDGNGSANLLIVKISSAFLNGSHLSFVDFVATASKFFFAVARLALGEVEVLSNGHGLNLEE